MNCVQLGVHGLGVRPSSGGRSTVVNSIIDKAPP